MQKMFGYNLYNFLYNFQITFQKPIQCSVFSRTSLIFPHVAEHTKAITVSCRTLSNIRGRCLPHQNKEMETEFDQPIREEKILYDTLAP